MKKKPLKISILQSNPTKEEESLNNILENLEGWKNRQAWRKQFGTNQKKHP
jgi:hypothetical protein